MNYKRLNEAEIDKVIKNLKKDGKYEDYIDMIREDFEEHRIVYKLSEREMIATAYVNKTTPFMMKDFYNWFEMNLLTEEDDGI